MNKPKVRVLRLETRSNLDPFDHFAVVDANPKVSFNYMLNGVDVVELAEYNKALKTISRLRAQLRKSKGTGK